jgi:hypothetical protein
VNRVPANNKGGIAAIPALIAIQVVPQITHIRIKSNVCRDDVEKIDCIEYSRARLKQVLGVTCYEFNRHAEAHFE